MIRTLLHTAAFLLALGSAAFSNVAANAQTLVLQGGKVADHEDFGMIGNAEVGLDQDASGAVDWRA